MCIRDRDAGHWPISLDGRLRPEPNHGNGLRGLPDEADENFGTDDPTCMRIEQCRYGVSLFATGGNSPPRVLTVDPRGYFLDADLSPDGLRLRRVLRPFGKSGTRVETLDLSSGNAEPDFTSMRAYHQLRWLDAAHYLLRSEGYGCLLYTSRCV